MSPIDLSPEAARDALASADRMAQAGRRRASWPRWAMAVEALFIGAMVLGLGFFSAHFRVSKSLIDLAPVAGAMIIGLWFRFFCVRRYGAVSTLNWLDAIVLAGFLAGMVTVSRISAGEGIDWRIWAISGAMSIVHYGRYELRRLSRWRADDTEPQK
jgi:hypothetical protein